MGNVSQFEESFVHNVFIELVLETGVYETVHPCHGRVIFHQKAHGWTQNSVCDAFSERQKKRANRVECRGGQDLLWPGEPWAGLSEEVLFKLRSKG